MVVMLQILNEESMIHQVGIPILEHHHGTCVPYAKTTCHVDHDSSKSGLVNGIRFLKNRHLTGNAMRVWIMLLGGLELLRGRGIIARGREYTGLGSPKTVFPKIERNRALLLRFFLTSGNPSKVIYEEEERRMSTTLRIYSITEL